MSSNYPEGSMKGSGIYSQTYSGTFNCETCEADFECDGETNDWQTMAFATCPKCEADLEKELPEQDEDWDFQDPEK